jgi:hypothetical protein
VRPRSRQRRWGWRRSSPWGYLRKKSLLVACVLKRAFPFFLLAAAPCLVYSWNPDEHAAGPTMATGAYSLRSLSPGGSTLVPPASSPDRPSPAPAEIDSGPDGWCKSPPTCSPKPVRWLQRVVTRPSSRSPGPPLGRGTRRSAASTSHP